MARSRSHSTYIDGNEAVCKARKLGYTRNLWCDRPLKFNNGCAILRNCRQGGEPNRVKDGDFFADLIDCAGPAIIGRCNAWHGGTASKTCAWQERGRISYSRVACKTGNYRGEEFLGPVSSYLVVSKTFEAMFADCDTSGKLSATSYLGFGRNMEVRSRYLQISCLRSIQHGSLSWEKRLS